MKLHTKNAVDSVHKYCCKEVSKTIRTIKFCKMLMWFEIGVMLGCVVIGFLLIQENELYLHLSGFFFCGAFFEVLLILQERYLIKCNNKLFIYQTRDGVGASSLKETIRSRDIIKDRTELWMKETGASIVNAYLLSKDKSVSLILVHISSASGIPKKAEELREELDKMTEDIDIHILLKSNDGNDYSKIPKMIPGSLQYDKEKGWVLI